MNTFLIGIDHIQIVAPPGSEDAARHFYGELLGMKEIPKPENLKARGGCWFLCGLQEVHIGIQSDFTPAKKAHPGFTVNALEQLKLRLQEANYMISDEVVHAFSHTIRLATGLSFWSLNKLNEKGVPSVIFHSAHPFYYIGTSVDEI